MKHSGSVTAHGRCTRGAGMELRHILRRLKNGFEAAITPGGPRGPREVVQSGIIAAARLSGAPIVPVAFSCSKKNYSIHGIASWFRCLSAAVCFSTVLRFA